MNTELHNNNSPILHQEEDFISISELWDMVVSRWYLVAISTILCLGVATLYILKTPPVYKRTASVLIKDDGKGKSLTSDINSAFSELGLFQSSANINNELISIKSPMLLEEVVRRLDLQTTYEQPEILYRRLLYGSDLPVTLHFLNLPRDVSVSCRMSWDKEDMYLSDFHMNGEKLDAPEVVLSSPNNGIKTPIGEVFFKLDTLATQSTLHDVKVTRNSLYDAVSALEENIKVSLADEKATILNLSILDRSQNRGDDILTTLMAVYNESWLMDKNQSAVNVSSFIDNRLDIIERDLGRVDKNITTYKTEHLVPDIEAASSLFLNQVSEVHNRIVELRSRVEMAKQIRNLLMHLDKSKLLPVNSFINNPALEKQIIEFNELLLKRNNLIKNSGEFNPLVEDLEHSLESLKRVVMTSLDNQLLSLETQLNSLYASEQKSTQRIAASPEQANYLMTEGRQQKVKEALYLFLLQKKEENELSKAFTASNTRIISEPQGAPLPAFPNKRNIYLAALVLGVILPVGLMYAVRIMDDKVRSKEDLSNRVSMPLLGQVPQLHKSIPVIGRFMKQTIPANIVVEPNTNDLINEAFRSIRTNLEFLVRKGDKRIIMTTSLIPASGKSFSVINLAKSLAIKGSKVLIIDLDIRKGIISKLVTGSKLGIADYLGEVIDNYQEIVIYGEIYSRLDVIPVGSIPPNPTELLSSDRLRRMLSELRNFYDYIILDCPPAEIVADADIIARVADMTIFVVRAGTINVKELNKVEEMYTSNRYPNISLLMNGVNLSGKRYGYGYTYGYVKA